MMIRKVLLVEDDPDDRDLFITFFSIRKDLQILPVAGNGAELIAYLGTLTSDTQLPDLIVLDQNMPVMNGKQTLKILREHDRYAQIPTVIYSTYADSSLIIDCKNLGAKMVAMKPIDNTGYQKMMDDFLDIIQ